jgi:signal transduction histidine kinase
LYEWGSSRPNFSAEMRKIEITAVYRLVYWFRILFLLVLCVIYLVFNEHTQGWVLWFALSAPVLFFMNHLLLLRWHGQSRTIPLLAVDFAAAASYGIVYLHGNYPDQLFVGLVGLVLLLNHTSRIVMCSWFGMLLVYWTMLFWIEWHYAREVDGVYVFVNIAFVLFTSGVGLLIRFYQDARDRAVALNNQLLAYANQSERLAVEQERARIAGEIHDSAGHLLTALLIQLQSLRRIQHVSPEQREKALEKCEDVARTALQELRLSVSAIQEEGWRGLSLWESVRQLTDDFSSVSGIAITYIVTGSDEAIPYPLRLTVFRMVQEALTNAKKHGEPKQIKIGMECRADRLTVQIEDDGRGQESWNEGFGLQTMNRRVTQHGGSLHVDSVDGKGFRIRSEFPLSH